MTSLGKSCLSYMVQLKPALEARGYELAVFHSTGMGGRAFEALAEAGAFCAVMDFCLQELANHLGGSVVSSGAGRLTGAGRRGTPQIVAPGAVDMVDFPAWQPVPAALAGRAVHVHNRLIASATSAAPLRRAIAAEIGARLAAATGPELPAAAAARRRAMGPARRAAARCRGPAGLHRGDARRGGAAHALHRARRAHQRRCLLRRRTGRVRRLGGAGPGAARESR